ncbi:MAG: hypothetical protein M3N93_04785 [Acidobacteriota bacterium]|nr:hypothetical protein [Acidobacteriota bacterium]
MRLDAWEHRVLLFLIACHGVLLWRLWSQKLVGVYLFLTVYLLGEVLQGLALRLVNWHTTLYGWIYVLTTPILWILAYFIVVELYRLIFEDYPGISSVGRKAVTWCMGLAILISVLYAIPDLKSNHGRFPVLHLYYVVERSTVLGLLLFLVLIQVFLIRYRLRLSPNRIIYATGYAIYFGITVAQDVIFTSLGVQVVDTVGIWTNIAAASVLLAGAFLLSARGEVAVQLEAVDSSSDRARLQQQLTDINRMLAKAIRGG